MFRRIDDQACGGVHRRGVFARDHRPVMQFNRGAARRTPKMPARVTVQSWVAHRHYERERGTNKVNKANEFDGPSLRTCEKIN